MFNPKQHYYVGGNTKVYGAVLFRFRERDFGAVHHVDGVSPAWPLSYADLEPWYTAAEALYTVHGQRGADPTEAWASGPYPWPAMSHEPRIEQLAHDLKGAGLTPFPLPLGIMLDEETPERSACIRCATCDGFACLVKAKSDAQVVCVEPGVAPPQRHPADPRPGAAPGDVSHGKKVTKVLVERDGQLEEFAADVVVVSAGAINSAALLLASASDAHPHGLANSLRPGGPQPDDAQQLLAHRHLQDPQPDPVREDARGQRLLLRRRRVGLPARCHADAGQSDAFTISLDAPDAEDPADLAARSLDFWLTTEDLPRPAEPGPGRRRRPHHAPATSPPISRPTTG